jgi:hypothetical protein
LEIVVETLERFERTVTGVLPAIEAAQVTQPVEPTQLVGQVLGARRVTGADSCPH